MTYTPGNPVVKKLGEIENTIRIAAILIAFILSVGFIWLTNEVQELQSVDTIEVVEDE